MPTAEQIKALIKSHFESDSERFITLTLQIAAHEAHLGHNNLADGIKKIIDKTRQTKNRLTPLNQNLHGLVIESFPSVRISDMVLPKELIERIKRIEKEFIQRDKLHRHNLENRRKMLFSGPPGTGKTMTAGVIARELNLPLYIILMDKLVTKFMGETSAKLRQVFDLINERQGVYLFDEFDAIGAERARDNDVGEMRRVLNSFLQFIEMDSSDSLIIAATNNVSLLDQALFRRFDDVLHYYLPSDEEKSLLIKNRIGNYINGLEISQISESINSLSHAEISQACSDAIKETILSDKKMVTRELLEKMFRERTNAYLKERK